MNSKTGTGPGAPAAVACVVCCALPILITAGALSGGAAVSLADSMPVIAVALAVAAAVAAWRRSRHGAGCGGRCGQQGTSTACSCATTRT